MKNVEFRFLTVPLVLVAGAGGGALSGGWRAGVLGGAASVLAVLLWAQARRTQRVPSWPTAASAGILAGVLAALVLEAAYALRPEWRMPFFEQMGPRYAGWRLALVMAGYGLVFGLSMRMYLNSNRENMWCFTPWLWFGAALVDMLRFLPFIGSAIPALLPSSMATVAPLVLPWAIAVVRRLPVTGFEPAVTEIPRRERLADRLKRKMRKITTRQLLLLATIIALISVPLGLTRLTYVNVWVSSWQEPELLATLQDCPVGHAYTGEKASLLDNREAVVPAIPFMNCWHVVGDRLAYLEIKSSPDNQASFHVFAGSNEIANFPAGSREVRRIVLAPDGKRLAFLEQGKGIQMRLVILRLPDGERLLETPATFGEFSLAWTPDGRALVVNEARPRDYCNGNAPDAPLLQVRADTGRVSPLGQTGYSPSFSKDGTLYFCNRQGAWRQRPNEAAARLPFSGEELLEELVVSPSGDMLLARIDIKGIMHQNRLVLIDPLQPTRRHSLRPSLYGWEFCGWAQFATPPDAN